MSFPTEAEVVIIGGGIIGCSIAYHLTKRGVKDVIVLERKQLTCGTTWHAAGLVSMLWPTPALTNLAKYAHSLYGSLEEETGQATGYRRIGSLSLARTEARLEELKRNSSLASVFGVDSRMVNHAEVEALYPGINMEGVVGSLYIERDGQTNPIDTTMALAKGARMGGAQVIEDVTVTDMIMGTNHRGQPCARGVKTNKGDIKAKQVILASGLWSRDFAKKINIDLPLYACEHQYIVTENMPNLTKRPVMRDFDKGLYFKEDAGKMLVGWFETNAIGCPMSMIGKDFCFDEFDIDMEHIEPYVMGSMETFPELEQAGIRTFFNGPESFTNDNLHLLGPTPQVDNFWVACGMNSKGIGAGAGVGKVMADWIVDGHPSEEITETDIKRNNPVQCTQSYVEARIPEALGHTYAMHWPFYQYETARDLKKSPLHDELEKQQACFGEVGGYERPNWFAQNGAEKKYVYSYKRSNWFDFHASEHMAVRQSVGICDMSSFGKFKLAGADALATLQNLSCANMDVEPGKVVYTQWLNERGGIEADVTIARAADDKFIVMSGIGSMNRDWWRLKSHLQGDAELVDHSDDYACVVVQGPNARRTLEKIVESDLSNDKFEFGTGLYAKIANVGCWMQRISYMGELGWELLIPTDEAVNVYRAIKQAGNEFDIRNVGMHTVNSLRLEKGFRHWGHDIAAEDNLIQAGLSFTAKPDLKDFIGRDAFIEAKAKGLPDRRLVQFKLNDPEPMLYHNEPIIMNDDVVGYLSSAMYGHFLGASIGMGYVNAANLNADALATANFEIEVATVRHSATASLRALYDPTGANMRS